MSILITLCYCKNYVFFPTTEISPFIWSTTDNTISPLVQKTTKTKFRYPIIKKRSGTHKLNNLFFDFSLSNRAISWTKACASLDKWASAIAT